MLHFNDRKLVWFIKYLPISIIVVSAIIINAAMFFGINQKVKALVEVVKTDYVASQKLLIETQVLQVSQQVEHIQLAVNHEIKKKIKLRMDRAYTMAQNIYSSNQHLPEDDLKRMIIRELRKLRYDDGRGYIYLYDMDGNSVMHPIIPEIESTNRLHVKDVNGDEVIKSHIDSLQGKQGAYSRYWYIKPGHGDVEFEKISYNRRFEPFNWYLGTGEYVVDIEQLSQERILTILSQIKIGDNGYIFVFEKSGKSLLTSNRITKHTSRNAYDVFGEAFMHDVLSVAKLGGFVDYQTYDKSGTFGPKSSYMKELDRWGWIIGTGVYLDQVNESIELRKDELLLESRQEYRVVLAISLIATLLCIFLSVLVSRKVSARFIQMETRIANDFNRLQTSQRRLQHMAKHDSLTALPNRSELELRIAKSIAHSKLEDKLLAVVFLDLDDFKRINDQYGHTYGDELLRQIGQRFESVLGSSDTVSRFGGDEFVFCLSGLNEIAEAEEKVIKIRNTFKQEFNLGSVSVNAKCSAGVAMYPYDGCKVEELLTKADIVLYKAKESHKGDAIFYDDVINKQVQFDFAVEEHLEHAITNRELNVVYQPQVDSKTQQLKGIEALCRWENPELGFVSPLDFIPAAERTGQIHMIGEYVLKQACRDTLRLMPNGEGAVGVSVNVSPKQLLEPEFVYRVTRLVAESGLDAKRVTLEITENILIKELNIVEPILLQLREYGFGISLDDFGTGFSSLNYLNTLPISEIKIDRSFIGKLNTSQHSETLVKAIIEIGASCQMKVVAEGVETNEQLQTLKQYQCDLLQGYYFDKPLSANALIESYTSDSEALCCEL
ncbi:EAL domain-containing protein [Vibrio sp. T187]|uniref:bifunctional diguanylate cyclase/phosphodiesterase n=1 Tax=Vibrio TaxID=662 RepID=UPI0010C9BB9C|nr:MULTISPECIES: EAL domain-containing protein [Vibrio]MBW3695847.1 EAL domain-containing protein [Vibrio sp. T187]